MKTGESSSLYCRSETYIGTAAWTIPKEYRTLFPDSGSQLEKYATKFTGVEINTSFYRDHKADTYRRWRDAVPARFRFSVKLSKVFTHEQSLRSGPKDLGSNLADISELGPKLGCLLIQLPPKLSFSVKDANGFFSELRRFYHGSIVFEPRHSSWDDTQPRDLLRHFGISRVVADPQPYFSRELEESDFSDTAYFRLHGSPVIYRSDYEPERLINFTQRIETLRTSGLRVWCIFDNTTFGHSTGNALQLKARLEQGGDFVGNEFARGLSDVEAVR